MADAKSLRMDAARKALDEKRGRAVYPRSNPYSTQAGLDNLVSELRDIDKSHADNQRDASAMHALESHRRATKQAAPEVPYPFEQNYQDLRYSGRGMKDPHHAVPAYTLSTMEDDDLELSRLLDRGSHGDVRPEMAELAKRDADVIVEARDLGFLVEDAVHDFREFFGENPDDHILLPTEKEPLTDEERSKVEADFRDMIMRRILGR